MSKSNDGGGVWLLVMFIFGVVIMIIGGVWYLEKSESPILETAKAIFSAKVDGNRSSNQTKIVVEQTVNNETIVKQGGTGWAIAFFVMLILVFVLIVVILLLWLGGRSSLLRTYGRDYCLKVARDFLEGERHYKVYSSLIYTFYDAGSVPRYGIIFSRRKLRENESFHFLNDYELVGVALSRKDPVNEIVGPVEKTMSQFESWLNDIKFGRTGERHSATKTEQTFDSFLESESAQDELSRGFVRKKMRFD